MSDEWRTKTWKEFDAKHAGRVKVIVVSPGALRHAIERDTKERMEREKREARVSRSGPIKR